MGMANSLKKQGRLEEALEYYDDVLRLKGKKDELMENKGSLLIKLGRFDEAKECYDHITILRNFFITALVSLTGLLIGIALIWLSKIIWNEWSPFSFMAIILDNQIR